MTVIKTKVGGRTVYYGATYAGRIILSAKSQAAAFTTPELAATVLKHLQHLAPEKFAAAELVSS